MALNDQVAPDGVSPRQLESARLGVLSLAVLAIATLVAVLVIVLRGDKAPTFLASPVISSTGLELQVALPSLGIGAPRSLDEFASLDALAQESRTEITARRYASHLVADIVRAPLTATAPLASSDQVQVALTVAANPALFRELVDADSGPISRATLAIWLGIDPDEALPPSFSYTIQPGDTVSKLSNRFGIEPESILFNNFELRDPNRLPVGGELTIPTADGLVYTVLLGDTLFEIAENFAADVDEILAFEGNNLASANQLVEGTTILLVGGSASVLGPIGSAGPIFAPLEFRWPIGGPGVQLSDFYGAPRANRFGFHTGIDLSAPTGTFVGSTAAGIVIQAGWDGSFGLSVMVDHGGGFVSRYSHLSQIDVFLRAFVEAGTLIGFSGSTGLSSGPHLHFEIMTGGYPDDPLIWLNS
jgi:murein DD-endopeptidase MepM/ murein hydrolase activator NlpD